MSISNSYLKLPDGMCNFDNMERVSEMKASNNNPHVLKLCRYL